MMDTLENNNPNSTVPLFLTVTVDVPDLTFILQGVPEEVELRVPRALADKMDEDN